MTDDIAKRIIADRDRRIDAHGWTCISVFAEKGAPSFAYSVAFEETFKHPEVMLIGFEPNLSMQLIAGIADGLKSREIFLPHNGGRASGVIRDFDVLVRRLPDVYAFSMARLAAERAAPAPIRLLQICLPDAEGRLPDEPGCNPDFKRIQDYSQFTLS